MKPTPSLYIVLHIRNYNFNNLNTKHDRIITLYTDKQTFKKQHIIHVYI